MVQPSARRLRNKPEVPEMNPFRMLSAAQNIPIIRSVLRKVSGMLREVSCEFHSEVSLMHSDAN